MYGLFRNTSNWSEIHRWSYLICASNSKEKLKEKAKELNIAIIEDKEIQDGVAASGHDFLFIEEVEVI